MFETSVVHTQMQAGERRAGLLTLSLAAHGLVISSLVLAGLRSISFPEQAPKELSYPLLAVPVTLPPALGRPEAPPRHVAAPATSPVTPVAPPAEPAAPQLVPESVQPGAASSAPAPTAGAEGNGTSTASGEGRGVPWGAENGVGVEGPPASVEQAPAAPLAVTGDVKAPIVIHRVQPAYPRVALMGRMSGTVVVQCIVDRNGKIRDTRVVRSTFEAFEQPAVDAVRQWIFAPGTLHGQPVDTIFELTVSFRVTQ